MEKFFCRGVAGNFYGGNRHQLQTLIDTDRKKYYNAAMIKAIAFDIDGTLYKSSSFAWRCIPFTVKNFRFMIQFGAVRKALRSEKVRTASADEFFLLQAQMLAARLGWTVAQTKQFINERIYRGWKDIFKKIKAYPRAHETIRYFHERGLKVGLLSDFPPEQKNDIWGIADLSDAIIGSENCGALKPDILPFLKLAATLCVNPKDILYVGNSYRYDIVGAKNAGMKTAYICSPIGKFFKRKKADIVFSNYREFRQKLERLLTETHSTAVDNESAQSL